MKRGKTENDKCRIVIYGHKTIPSREGGIEVVVQEMSVRMASHGYQVTCLNRGGNHSLFENEQEVRDGSYHGVRMETVPTIDRSGLAAFTSSFFAAWKAALGRYDIVHIHAEGPAAFCWIPKLFGKKVIVTVHGLDWQRDKWHGFARKYIRYGEQTAARYADEIIVLSHRMGQYFEDVYNRKTTYIPNGTEILSPECPDLIRTEFGLEKDGYILYLGRLVPEKKADVLIRAFRNLDTDKKLVIAGPDSETDEYIQHLHELAEGDPRIIFTGFVKGQMYRELMSNTYCYVLPSGLEGMPLSLLEAMSYGNCCITSDIPECKEIIGERGITVAPGDVDQLHKAMQVLLDNPLAVEKYRKETRDLVKSRESWDEVVLETLTVYNRLAGSYPSGHMEEPIAIKSGLKHLS